MANQRETLAAAGAPTDRPIEVVDLRSDPPPEPLVQTLELLADLPDETVLLQRNDRIPQLLFPKLDDRGYQYETLEGDDEKRTVIWRR